MTRQNDQMDGGDLQVQVAGGTMAVAPVVDERKRRRRMYLLLLLATLVVSVAALDVYYLVTRKPITEILPPAVAVAKTLPPAFVASFYGASAPMGIAVSPDAQRVYVSELEGDRMVRAFDRSGRELFSIATGEEGAARRQPAYLAVSPQGQLYVADRLSARISTYSPDGRFVSDLAAPEEAGISSPLGLAFDRSGNLLVTDTTGAEHKLVVLDPQGNLVMRAGKTGEEPGDFSFPNQAAADSQGRIYVTNGNLGRVDTFGKDGAYLGALATDSGPAKIGLPRGIAVDHLDRLFVVDSVGCNVQVFDVSGEKPSFLYSLGGEGDGNGQLRYPTGVAVDSTGRVYVADRANFRVQIWNY